MFKTPNVAVRIAAVNIRQMEQDEKEIGLVELTCEVNPLTATLAGDLHDFVKRTLYTAAEVEVNSLMASASFALSIRPQEVTVRMAPDQKNESFVIDEAKVDNIKAKRSKKTSAWVLEFHLTFSPANPKQLQQTVDAYLKTRYLNFTDAEACLFDAEVDETPRIGPGTVGTESAATH